MNILLINRFPPFFLACLGVMGLIFCFGNVANGAPLNGWVTPPKPVPVIDRDPCDHPMLWYCTQLRDITIGRYLLKIPHNFIRVGAPGNKFIELMLRWPGMTGSRKGENFDENFDVFDLITILIHTERPRRPTEAGIQDLIRRLKLTGPELFEKLGLLEYKHPVADPENIFWTYYKPINNVGLLPRGQPIFIQCSVGPSRRGNEETVRCTEGYTVRTGHYITIRFSKRHLRDWKDIITSSRDLVESFIQE